VAPPGSGPAIRQSSRWQHRLPLLIVDDNRGAWRSAAPPPSSPVVPAARSLEQKDDDVAPTFSPFPRPARRRLYCRLGRDAADAWRVRRTRDPVGVSPRRVRQLRRLQCLPPPRGEQTLRFRQSRRRQSRPRGVQLRGRHRRPNSRVRPGWHSSDRPSNHSEWSWTGGNPRWRDSSVRRPSTGTIYPVLRDLRRSVSPGAARTETETTRRDCGPTLIRIIPNALRVPSRGPKVPLRRGPGGYGGLSRYRNNVLA
jgi:hypothetical protein